MLLAGPAKAAVYGGAIPKPTHLKVDCIVDGGSSLGSSILSSDYLTGSNV